MSQSIVEILNSLDKARLVIGQSVEWSQELGDDHLMGGSIKEFLNVLSAANDSINVAVDAAMALERDTRLARYKEAGVAPGDIVDLPDGKGVVDRVDFHVGEETKVMVLPLYAVPEDEPLQVEVELSTLDRS